MPENGLVPIGELARRTGVASSALRYYEQLGLLAPAARLGFTLAEIRRLLAASSRGRRAWDQLAERKIAELDARIADAQRARELVEHVLECPHRDIPACPNFRSAVKARLERPASPHR